MRLTLLTPLAGLLLLVPLYADESPPSATESALLDAASKCPLTLGRALEHAYGSDRRPLRADLVLDTAGRLMARAWVRVVEDDKPSFEEWIGPLGKGGWVPTRQDVTDEARVATAAQLWVLLEPEPNVLRKALDGALRTEERAGAGEIALSITPMSRVGRSAVSLSVAVDGEVRGLLFDPDSSTYTLGAAPPEPERVPQQVRSLPALEVPDGRWFNAEEAPTPAAWAGHPVLVIVTDPG